MTSIAPLTAAQLAAHPAWVAAKDAALRIRPHQQQDGAASADADRGALRAATTDLAGALRDLAPLLPHDEAYLGAAADDAETWAAGDFGVPDFGVSLAAFHPERIRVDHLPHAVVFPMYTQNGSAERLFEAVLLEVIWPDFVAALEAGEYGNAAFLPIRFVDFTPGYDTNSATLFPESVAFSGAVAFTWGAIFADREAARYRRVVRAAAATTRLELPAEDERMLADQSLAEEVFVMWDLIHDRTHMRGDLPFDPFMIKQRMPYFLYSLEELRCDLTAFREALRIERDPATDEATRERAHLVQHAVLFDRVFRFAITGTRIRNYDGVGGQLLFAWLHRRGALHWTDTSLAIDWDVLPDAVLALSDAIGELYWSSIDRPKLVHWLAAYELVSGTLAPHPASRWARGLPDEVLAGPPKGYTDAVLDDEFPLSMFHEALQKKMAGVIGSTAGITGTTPDPA